MAPQEFTILAKAKRAQKVYVTMLDYSIKAVLSELCLLAHLN